jgi:cell division septal protein FtsQ
MNGKKKFFVTNQGDVVKYVKLQGYENLPLVFGKNINFKNFFNEINKKDVFFNKIEKFLYFEIGRWDIILKDGKTIKLPNKNYLEILDNFILMSKEKNFDKYNVFDFRIKDQLILK